jgi:hypothetical protein
MHPPYHDPDSTVPSSALKSAIGNPQSAIRRVGFIFAAALCMALISATAQAQTTYTWQGADGAGFNVSTNWNPTRTPTANSDLLVFNTGTTLTVTGVPTTTVGRVTVTNNTSITFQPVGVGSNTLTVGNQTGDDLVIASGSSLTLSANGGGDTITLTLAASGTADISGTLTINSGQTYNTNLGSVVTTVSGILSNAGTLTTITSATKLVFVSGGKYTHNQNAGTLPTATWNSSSTCEVTGWTSASTQPGGLGQSFGNFTWNSTGQTGNPNFAGALTTVTGTFTVSSTGSGAIRLAGSTSPTLNISGDFVQSGGTFDLNNNTGGSSTANLSGNFNISGGTLTRSVSGSSTWNFNKAGTQTFTKSGGAISGGINFTVSNGSTLNMGSNVLDGSSGTFTLSSGATLGIGSTAGITSSGLTGNVQVTGTRTFDTAANYTYNATSGQSTGNGLPATVNNLTISAIGVVSLTADVTINGNFGITTGTSNGAEFAAGTRSVTLKGNYDNTSGIYSSSFPGLLTFAGATSLTANTANNAFPSVTIAPGSTLTHGAITIRVSGNWLDNSTTGGASGYSSSGFTQFTPGGAVTRTIGGSVTAPAFNNLQIVATSGAIVQAAKGLDINGRLELNSGTFDDGGFSHTVHRDWLKSAGTTYTATGTITFDGQFGSAIDASNFNNVAINKDSQATSITLSGDITVAGTVTLTSGNLSPGSRSISVGSNWSNSATFTAGSSTVTFNGSNNTQTISGNTTFNNLTINHSGANSVTAAGSTLAVTGLLHVVSGTFTSATQYGDVTIDNGATLSLSGDISVSGTWTNNGTFNSNGFTVTFNGSVNQSLGGSQPTSFAGLNISNTAGVTLFINTTVTVTLTLTGDITTGSFTVFMGNGATSAGTGDVVGSVNRGDIGATTRRFGNPDVQITETAGDVSDITVTLFKGLSPNDFSNSVRRIYRITPNNGTNAVSATVRLHYLDGELNNNSEGTLDLWRKSTGWMDQDPTQVLTTRHDDTSGDQNWVEQTGVTQFSDWTLANHNIVPTAVDAVLMKATRYDNRVLLEWHTGYEVNNVGFNVYRERNGNLERVTREPVAGSALIAGPGVVLTTGFAYSLWDEGIADCRSRADCQNLRYFVEDLDLTGRTTTHGPFAVELAPPDQTPPPGKGQAPLLSGLGSDASVAGSTAQVEPKANAIKPTPALEAAQAGLASQTAVKLSVQHEGWYRVELADLRAAGFPAGVDPQMVQLFVDGEQVPIVVTAGDPKPSWTGIEFYGIGIDSPSTANHVYWLVAGSQPGARITPAGASGGSPAPAAFSYTVERRDRVVYFPALKNGGGEKFFGPLVFNAKPTDQSLVLQHVAAAGANATLEVSVQGFTAAHHSVRVLLNGSELGALQFDGLAKGTAQYSIAQSELKEGSNQVQLISPAGFTDISMSEYVRLTYLHTNDADNNALRFPAAGSQQVTVKGFTDSNLRLIDVTIPGSPQELAGTVTTGGTGFSITANVPGTGARTLLAFAPDQQKKPAAMAANQPSSWRDPSRAGDYLVITRRDLIDSLGPLVAHRKSQGLTPAVVDIEDVYDEFSFGNKTPQALKDFISYAKGSWAKPPRFVVLAGGATYDPKNYTGFGDFDLVPTKLVETAFNETATDDWFVDVNNDGLPDIPVGRLPVRTPDETAALVSKIVGYDDTVRTKSVLLVADRNSGFDFEAANTQLRSLIPAKVPVTDIRRGQVGDSDARSQLLNAINQGQRLVNYYGHGSTRLWTEAQTLTAADAANFVNIGHLSLFVSMTCLNGFFHDPAIESLGESLLKAQGGAIAVWASSGLTDATTQVVMNQAAIKQLLGPLSTKSTIGEHIMRAKIVISDVDVRRTWILLGDPATRLK